MPYAPPCYDDYHATVVSPYCRVENRRIEKKYQSKSGILNTGFDSQGSSVLVWNFEKCSGTEADSKSKKIVHQHNKENISDALHECIDVVSECQDDHKDEECHREILHRLLQRLCHLRQISVAEHIVGLCLRAFLPRRDGTHHPCGVVLYIL